MLSLLVSGLRPARLTSKQVKRRRWGEGGGGEREGRGQQRDKEIKNGSPTRIRGSVSQHFLPRFYLVKLLYLNNR